MGSWDATCGISKMPIRCGDEVVDFFIGEVASCRESGFICYSNDLWTPVTIQTCGTYADYGMIKTKPGWHVDYVSAMLKNYAVKVEQGDNKYHDHPVYPATIDFDRAQDLIHGGRLFFQVPRSHYHLLGIKKEESRSPFVPSEFSRISRMMVHKAVFDEIVSWGTQGWRGGATLDMYVESGMKAVSDYHETDNDPVLRNLREIMMLNPQERNRFHSAFGDGENGDYYVPHKFSSYLQYVMNSDPEHTKEIVTELSKFIIFRARMNEMQFLWSPQTGSQNHAYAELTKLYTFCNKFMKDQLDADAEYDAQFDDPDDEVTGEGD